MLASPAVPLVRASCATSRASYAANEKGWDRRISAFSLIIWFHKWPMHLFRFAILGVGLGVLGLQLHI